MPNEAIERAAKAALETVMPDGDYFGDWLECMDDDKLETAKLFIRAAISAYFADVPVSQAMVDAGREVPCDSPITGGIVYSTPQEVRAIYKAMCAKHAEELSNGR